MRRIPVHLLVELALYALVAIAGWFGAQAAVAGAVASAGFRELSLDPTAAAAGQEAAAWFAGGVAAVAIARGLTGLRRGRHIATPLLLPAVLGAGALGLCVQLGYDITNGVPFAKGVFLAGVVAACILGTPGDLGALLSRGRNAFGLGALLLFLALALFGDAPGASDAKVNLGPVQPIEAVKVLTVLYLADTLARRAAKLRFQRTRAGLLRIPRPSLLVPSLALLVGAFAGLFLVKDFGPTLILGGVYLGLFYIVTRSPGWLLLALAMLVVALAAFGVFPELALSHTVETRLRMWTDPWLNGLANGDQLARARWALAAGGWSGSGLGASFPGELPAGHTDLIYAHLVEELGVAGAGTWLLLMGVAVTDGLRVAARNRTPERGLMAAGLGLLLVAQSAVILGGTLGLIPLTGVVVPFLSFGKTSMVAFVAVAALIARLGEDGEVRADTDELRELRGGVRHARWAVGGLAAFALVVTAVEAVHERDATSLRGVVTTQADGTAVLRHDRRVASIADAIRRGSIVDRAGRVLAESPTAGDRRYPLGEALGTVLGSDSATLYYRPKWSVERQEEATLRGYPDLDDGPAIWLGRAGGKERLLLAARSAAHEDPSERAAATKRLTELGGTGDIRRLALASPDLSSLLTLARLPLSERGEAVRTLSADVAARTITLSLDARLQATLATEAREAAAKSAVGAAAIVVIDIATGEMLARAQWPDLDPSAPLPMEDPKFYGIYGAWADKTGAHGVWQGGSVFKLVTAMAAVREGKVSSEGEGCVTEAGPSFACNDVTDGRTSFTLPEWAEPIHDFGDGGARGDVDLVEGITRSSNVYFGQLALSLGPEPFRRLREAGVEFGNPGLLDELDGKWTGIGAAGSRRLAQTGFGQGAGSWSVAQAARVAGAIGSGVYRRCPPDMLLGASCTAVSLMDPARLAPVLAGMRGVMERGTGAKLPKVEGVRIYGKTGTADAPGTRDEAPWGIRPATRTAPHSWFVAIAEPDTMPACGEGGHRYAIAAVVPHGGFGSAAAGPLAIEAVRALKDLGFL